MWGFLKFVRLKNRKSGLSTLLNVKYAIKICLVTLCLSFILKETEVLDQHFWKSTKVDLNFLLVSQ